MTSNTDCYLDMEIDNKVDIYFTGIKIEN